MWKTAAVTALLMTMLSVSAVAQDPKIVIEDAARAMGTAGLISITYSGSAAIGNFGQSRTISFRLASTAIRNYTRAIDFTQPASRATGDTLPPAVPGGPPPQPGTFDQTSTSRLERDGITKNTLRVGDSVRIWASPNRDPNDNRVRLK